MVAADTLLRRSVTIAGHRTSVSLEKIFWDALDAEVKRQNRSLASLIREIDEARTGTLSGAIRVYLMAQCQGATALPPKEAGIP